MSEEKMNDEQQAVVEKETQEQLNVESKNAEESSPKDYVSTVPKSLGNTDVNGAKKNVRDIVVFGDGDLFKLLCKASSQAEGWLKSTKAMEIHALGCVVQVTTQQRNPDGSYAVAEAVTFVPQVFIQEIVKGDEIVGRVLATIGQKRQIPESEYYGS